MKDLAEIANLISDFVATSPLNRVPELGMMQIFDTPLVGAAAAGDPLFARLKDPEVVRAEHKSPAEWLPGARTVISYFLPFSRAVRQANRRPGLPATEWLYGRIEGEAFNNALRRYLVEQVAGAGGTAVAPLLDERFAIVNRRSNWSERHAAFIAGLGTFGLSKSLITKKGCAGRYGSVVVSLELEPTPRPYREIYEYCSWMTDRECGDCIRRCPSGAIREEGKDVAVCSNYLDIRIRPRFAPRYGCGKCQTAVRCEDQIPVSS